MKIQFLKISLVVFFLVVTFSSLFCQKYDVEVKKLLPEGKVEFEVLDSVEATPRQVALNEKFLIAYQENFDAFNAYFVKIGKKEKAKYPKNKILSKKEFLELMNFGSNIKVISSQTEIVEVIYSDDNSISFKSDGKLEILNFITYYSETNTFDFDDEYTLTFVNSVNVETNTNALREPWQGYNWEFREMENAEEWETFPAMKDVENMSAKQYRITLGKLMNSEKTFMIIKIIVIQDGNSIIYLELPIRMK